MKGLSFILLAAVGSLILFGGHAVAKAKELAQAKFGITLPDYF